MPAACSCASLFLGLLKNAPCRKEKKEKIQAGPRASAFTPRPSHLAPHYSSLIPVPLTCIGPQTSALAPLLLHLGSQWVQISLSEHISSFTLDLVEGQRTKISFKPEEPIKIRLRARQYQHTSYISTPIYGPGHTTARQVSLKKDMPLLLYIHQLL